MTKNLRHTLNEYKVRGMNNETTLTDKETEMINTLIRLGDSKELAEKTVIANRSKEDNAESYRFAYES